MSRKGENIYKRKDGRWEARYIISRNEKGKARYGYLYARSYAEVKEMQKNAIYSISNQTARHRKSSVDSQLLENVSLRWLAYIRPKVKESSYVKYRTILEKYIIPRLGKHAIPSLDTRQLEYFFNALLTDGKSNGTGLSPKSVADIKSVVNNIFRFAEYHGIPVLCRTDHIIIKQSPGKICTLTVEEQHCLCQYLEQNQNLIHIGIYLCLYTGIRLGELCALRWKDICFGQNIIHVRRTMQRIADYSPTSTHKTKIVETPPKSSSSVRDIPLPTFLTQVLVHTRAQATDDAYILTGTADQFIEPRTMENKFHQVLRACGIPDKNFHCIRHTFATRCVELGFDVKSLSEIMGHADIHVTMNRYVHPSMQLKRHNMDKLQKI